jgi:hypothetical protein
MYQFPQIFGLLQGNPEQLRLFENTHSLWQSSSEGQSILAILKIVLSIAFLGD